MTKLPHLIMFILLILLSLNSNYPINAQESDTDQEELTPLPHAQVIVQLMDFANQSTEDCLLPCFSDFQPNETTLAEIREMSADLFNEDESILEQFDKPFERDDGLEDYTLRVDNRYATGDYSLSFIITPDNDVMQRFKAHLFRPANWLESRSTDISEILASLDMPDEIYLSIAASQPPQFSIVLGYENLGTVFLYTYRIEPEQLTQSEEPISLCGSWSQTYSVDVWIQAVDKQFYESLLEENLRISEGGGKEEIVYRAFWPLERMTHWNMEDLTQFLVENPEWCFDALSYEDLLEAGYSY